MGKQFAAAAALATAVPSAAAHQLSVRLVEDTAGLGRAGQVVTMTLAPSDVVINEVMDTFMVGYAPPQFRADEVCPIMLVDTDVGKYRQFGLANAFRPVNVLSSIQADIPEVDVDIALADYAVQERALGGFIPTVTQLNADAGRALFDPRVQVGRRIGWALALEREIRVWSLLKATGSWAAANRLTVGSGTKWNDPVNSDPFADIVTIVEASAAPVTDLWMIPPVAHSLLRSKNIKDYIRLLGGDAGPIGRDIAAATASNRPMDFTIPGLPPIHVVASKVLNESTGALDYILDDTVIATCAPAGGNAEGDEIMTCKTFRRRGPSGTGFTTREIQLDRRGLHGGTFLASGHAEVVKMISSTVGGIIINTIQ